MNLQEEYLKRHKLRGVVRITDKGCVFFRLRGQNKDQTKYNIQWLMYNISCQGAFDHNPFYRYSFATASKNNRELFVEQNFSEERWEDYDTDVVDAVESSFYVEQQIIHLLGKEASEQIVVEVAKTPNELLAMLWESFVFCQETSFNSMIHDNKFINSIDLELSSDERALNIEMLLGKLKSAAIIGTFTKFYNKYSNSYCYWLADLIQQIIDKQAVKNGR